MGGAGFCAAQAVQAPTKALQQSSPAVLTESHAPGGEVSLAISAYDGKHRPLLHLKPEDLAVTDNGTPVKLKQMHLVHGAANGDQLVTLVFDPFAGVAKDVRENAERVLQQFPLKGFSYSVLDLHGRLRVLQGFTSDRDAVERAIEVETGGQASATAAMPELTVSSTEEPAEKDLAEYVRAGEKEVIATARSGVDGSSRKVDGTDRARAQILLAALQNAQAIGQDEQMDSRLAELQALVEAQQGAPGRKALIYFTSNRPMDSIMEQQARAVAASAARAGVTVYVVDLDPTNDSRFYEVPATPKTEQAPAEGSANASSCPMCNSFGQSQAAGAAHRHSRGSATGDHANPIAALAENSGGLYMDGEIGLRKNLSEMIEDLTTYYEASYTAPPHEQDGSYRSIRIEPLLKKVHIQTMAGYYAIGNRAGVALRPFEASLVKVLDSGATRSEVPFKVTLLRSGDAGEGSASTLAVQLPVRALEVKRDEQTHLYSAHVSVFARVLDSAGAEVEHAGEDMNTRGDLRMADTDTLTMRRQFVAGPGRYTVDVAVADQRSGKVGVQHTTFAIADASDAKMGDAVQLKKASLSGSGAEGGPAADRSEKGSIVFETPGEGKGELVIVPASSAVPALDAAAAGQLIAEARERAVWYRQGLPDFICNEITTRTETAGAKKPWKLRDVLVEELRYANSRETRTTIEMNGERSSAIRGQLVGVLTAGEFGEVLHAIFAPEAQADFAWKSTKTAGNATLQVFDYKVDQKHSKFRLEASGGQATAPGFHGQVYIESGTRTVRRLSLIADDVPADFPITAARIDVDYGYVTLNNHDYLVPVSAETRVIEGKRLVLNSMQFRSYRRFGSSMRIVDFKETDK